MRAFNPIHCLIALCAFATVAQASSKFLQADLLEGWHAYDTEEYVTAEELFRYMNGGAELYLEYRYAGLCVREYEDENGNSLTVEIYSYATPQDAYGIYSIDTTGAPVDLGQGGRKTRLTIRFWKDRYYIRIFLWESKDELIPIPERAARIVDQKIDMVGELPHWLNSLIANGLSPSFIRGEIAIRQVAGSWQPEDLPTSRKGGGAWIPEGPKIPAPALVLNYAIKDKSARTFQRIWTLITGDAQNYVVSGQRGLVNMPDGSVQGLETVGPNLVWVPEAPNDADCEETLNMIRKILQGERRGEK
ncbi:hypothetical protein CEE37_06550 [candidate division LCP-89 bacterium B3_LCP]|uniref:Uncharacterized protein n=1 Tax=candidate division LCP-89 bacterium B3_LCP TaxID=2012998 RepID=A0A532V083_UNCL8|nr:MAG: hypothetical protein CEE37_06550 [candidate division LCP-89 bacterium B3_LCP]